MSDTSHRGSLELLSIALQDPVSLTANMCAGLATALANACAEHRELARGALAALVLGRPELVTGAHLDALLVATGDDPSETPCARAVLEGLVAVPDTRPTAAGPSSRVASTDGPPAPLDAANPAQLAAEVIWRFFERPAAPGSRMLRHLRHDLLLHLALWRPELVPLERVLSIAGELDPIERERCLGEIVEPLLQRAGKDDGLGTDALERLAVAFGVTRQWRFTVSALAQRPEATAPLVHAAAVLAERHSSHRSVGGAVLAGSPFHLLLVHNVNLGQGDEIIRFGPLLQALLGGNPRFVATVVTTRPYLYEHPRIRAVSIRDDGAVAGAFDAPFDGLMDVFEPGVAELCLSPEVAERVARRLASEEPPPVVIRCHHGPGHFTFAQVIVAGEDLTDRLELRHRIVRSVYSCSQRLVLEMGLPWLPASRAAGCGGDTDPFTAVRSDEAARLWSALGGDGARPVALVCPFGGRSELKGYLRDRVEVLAGELGDLVREGYRAVVLPPGEPWADTEVFECLMGTLPRAARPHVAIAPDPAASAADAASLALHEQSHLRHGDRVMRLFKHFATYADLVVTVEGWLGHLAGQLGRPARVVLMEGSFSPDWYARGERVEFAGALSHLSRSTIGVLDSAAPPPLPRRAQKGLYEASLGALRRAPVGAVDALLRRALTSPAPGVRAAAIRGLSGSDRKQVIELLESLLADPEPAVRQAASEELLAAADRGTAIRVKRELLRAHCLIASLRFDAVLALGDDALPALSVASSGGDEVIRREARRLMARLLAERASARFSKPLGPLPTSA